MLQRERVCCLLLSFFISSIIYILTLSVWLCQSFAERLLWVPHHQWKSNILNIEDKMPYTLVTAFFSHFIFHHSGHRRFQIISRLGFCIHCSLSASKILPSFTWKILAHPSTLDSNVTSDFNPFLTPKSSSGLPFWCINCKLSIYVFISASCIVIHQFP